MKMAGHSLRPGVSTALLFIVSVMSVKGIPLPDDRLSTNVGDVKSRIFNETENELSRGIIDRHVACRACKQLIINGRFAMIVEKNAISEYFTDPCYEFFTDHEDRRDCQLVIQQKVDKIYNDIFNILDAQYWCMDILHLCSKKAEYAEADSDMQNEIPVMD